MAAFAPHDIVSAAEACHELPCLLGPQGEPVDPDDPWVDEPYWAAQTNEPTGYLRIRLSEQRRMHAKEERKQFVVKTLTGKSITVDVALSDTIESIKQQICAQESIPTDQQRLLCNGKQLEDHRAVSDCNIHPYGPAIHLVPRLPENP